MKNHKSNVSFFFAPPDAVRRKALEDHLVAAYPFLRREVVGESILSREIAAFCIGDPPYSHVYVGAHHGLEWLTALLLYRFLDDLGKGIARRGMPDAPFSLAVIPCLNPDGVEIALHGKGGGGEILAALLAADPDLLLDRWQANARGVDLNHNYPTGFSAYKSIERSLGITGGCPTRYSGEHPFSEPETAALRGFLEKAAPALVLSLHTQGEEIFYHPTEPPVRGAAVFGAALAAITGYRLGEANGAAAYGGLSDWLAEEKCIPAFTLECGLGMNPLPVTAGEGIYRRLRRALFLALGFCGSTREPLVSPPLPDHYQRGAVSMSHVSGENIREKEVINSCDGRRLGYVSDIEFDICDGRITAIVLPSKGGFLGCGGENIVIPWEKIQKIGEDIILVDAEGCCPPPKPPRKR